MMDLAARLPRAGMWLVLVVALAASATSLRNDFTYDDIPIVAENAAVHEVRAPWAYFGESYWGSSRGNSLYRPVTMIAFSLEWVAGDGSPFPFHLANVLLYLATAALAYVLARELLGPTFGLFAGLFWAAHPVHVEAVANVVGQSEMLAALPMLLALLLYIRERTLGALTRRTTIAITACFALALLSKENGIVLPGLLVAAELAFRGGRFARPDGALGLARLARGFALVLLAYFTARFLVLGPGAGDAPHPALTGVAFGARQWVVLGLLPDIARLTLWPARLLADYSPSAVPVLTSPAPAHLLGAAILVLYVAALVLAWKRSRVAFFGLLWFPVAYAPVSNVLFASGILIAERTLFLPTLGVVIAVAVLAEALWARAAATTSPLVQRAIVVTAGLLLAAATAQSAARQLIWLDNPTLFATMVVDAPTNYRAHHALGELFGKAAAWDRAQEHLTIADSLFPDHDVIELSRARVYSFNDQCPSAVPFYRAVLHKRPDAEVAVVGLTACDLEMKRYADARARSRDALAAGLAPGVFRMMLEKADSALAANDTVDARNAWARAGKPTSKSESRLKLPVLLIRPPSYRGRRTLPEVLPVPPPTRASQPSTGR